MTEPNPSRVDNDTEPEDAIPENTSPEDTASEDMVPQIESASNAAVANQDSPSTLPRRDWLLYLPPEIRVMIFRSLLRLPFPLPYDLPHLGRHPEVQTVTGIFHTSRLIYRESTNVFYSENIFSVPLFPTLNVTPSQRIGDMIQNLTIQLPLLSAMRGARQRFIGAIRSFGDPAILRGTFSVHFLLYPRHRMIRHRLNSFLSGLGRFTNFRIVEVDLFYGKRPSWSTGRYCDFIQYVLQPVLGPASPCAMGHGLTFRPRDFVRSQPPREDMDWMDLLDGIRLDWNGEETSADQNADELESLAENLTIQG